ncbi:NADH-quinone oxidoreductase subunit L [Falsirhodobacter halotolerans]|uniref:NADH-quinone oxidoreductase subunit L n=1 Tax=Falsirhodobacter halotolerans TaxID=1146892 RepID=UPI001FD15046|nr:NADH-quinone oxidoreductase subunit L [Falsirhodobacter halotolerans]MCJ8140189.1 NADH-quinone oxidoreductase subunit L [Falsirhodobacter halotolerans]
MTTIIVLAPLLGALICGFGWRLLGETAAQVVATALVALAAMLSWAVFLNFEGPATQAVLMRWIESGSLMGDWSVRVDRLTAIMLVVVNTVSVLVHLYSFGYMAHDDNFRPGEHYRARFFAFLSLFTFAMLTLVTADNLVQLFFGWEGVGLVSYLLVGFYYRKGSANAAAVKAFVVNRVGDFGFLLAIAALYFLTDSVRLTDVFAAAPELAQMQVSFLSINWNAAEIVGVLLFIGAMGKSAQLGLHTWLADAMEGPTPVSALIHAATMVTAGVFLVCRMSPIYEFAPHAQTLVVVIGAASAFVAATIGLVQTDIKRVIAYSTMSQLGYMFVAAGMGVYSVAMFHLFTHAFFKALLFLGAGSVIHGMSGEQDLRNYGGLRAKMPATFWAMVVGTLALTGVGIPLTHIGFAGFVSKDAVIETAYAGSGLVFWVLVISAAMTAFYSWRLIFLTFFGAPRGSAKVHDHAHESGRGMLIPLAVLGVGAVLAGTLWYGPFFGDEAAVRAWFHIVEDVPMGQGALFLGPENHMIHAAHDVPAWVKVAPFVAMLSGLVLAWAMYIRDPALPARMAERMRGAHAFLLNKWYFDELFDRIFVTPARCLGTLLWRRGDERGIDGAVNGVALGIVPKLTRFAQRMQSGYVFHYAFAMVVGVAVLVTWVTLSGGAR